MVMLILGLLILFGLFSVAVGIAVREAGWHETLKGLGVFAIILAAVSLAIVLITAGLVSLNG